MSISYLVDEILWKAWTYIAEPHQLEMSLIKFNVVILSLVSPFISIYNLSINRKKLNSLWGPVLRRLVDISQCFTTANTFNSQNDFISGLYSFYKTKNKLICSRSLKILNIIL